MRTGDVREEETASQRREVRDDNLHHENGGRVAKLKQDGAAAEALNVGRRRLDDGADDVLQPRLRQQVVRVRGVPRKLLCRSKSCGEKVPDAP